MLLKEKNLKEKKMYGIYCWNKSPNNVGCVVTVLLSSRGSSLLARHQALTALLNCTSTDHSAAKLLL
jgi:hypothetical protein